RILSSAPFSPLVAGFGRDNVKRHLADYLQTLRDKRRPYVADQSVERVAAAWQNATETTLRRVINGSGIIIHTNLGRSPVDEAVWRSAEVLVSGYSNLEFDLDKGERGSRDEHLSSLAQTLFGAEAAVLTNNNAAGTLL